MKNVLSWRIPRGVLFLPVLLFLISWSVSAGDSQSGPRFWMGYFGELGTHPGISAGVQFPILESGIYELNLGPALGFYVHPRNHTALFLDFEIENRFQLPSGLYFSLAVNSGYFHSWLNSNAVYTWDDDSSTIEISDPGRPYVKSGLSLGGGWEFSTEGSIPFELFSRLQVFAQYPFNSAVLPHAAVIAGVAFGRGAAR